MSFFGTAFTFDGVSSEEYDLRLYDIGNTEQGTTEFASKYDIVEDRVYRKLKPLHYGTGQKDPLTFSLVCCASEERVATGHPFDRWDLEKISLWLIGHQQYKWLTIEQPDMEHKRYRCIISDLKTVEVFHDKWGFQFNVTCDTPYGYLLPERFTYAVVNSANVRLYSKSSINNFYYPKLTIKNSTGVTIKNSNDSNRMFSLSNISNSSTITVDNENGIITASDGLNSYKNFNFNFFRLVRGDNNLLITGNGTYTFDCEFPVNIGG